MSAKIEVSTDEAMLLRQALRTVIALNEGTLDSLRRMSLRQANLREEDATRAAERIVTARNLLDKLGAI